MSQSEFNFPVEQLPRIELTSGAGVCYLERDGARLAYDFELPQAGQSAGQLLILVNGFARPRTDFRAFRKRLHSQMPNLATLALDNRGAGDSEGGTANLTVRVMALDACFLAQSSARQLGLDTYHALGISMGGMICQDWAAGDPRMAALTLVSTTPGGEARVWPQGVDPEQARQKPFEAWPLDAEAMHRRMVRYFGPKFRKSSPLLIDMMVKNMLKSHTLPINQGRAKAQYDATVGFDGTPLLGKIRCPTLVLTGSDDEVIPPGNSDALCRLISGAKKVVFPEMGHLLLIEDPENFVAHVRSFLESLHDEAGGSHR
ncbi:alpha/beta hydrolase [bacterium]|nr:alpha/beta hydrolase [bacterium]